jgi:primary-amine oxidase
MEMNMKHYLASAGLLLTLGASAAMSHPLDGLTADEYQKINQILREQKVVDDHTLYPLIELKEPGKADVLKWKEGDKPLDREAKVQLTSPQGFKEAVVNITKGTVESTAPIKGQPMVLFTEFMDALQGVLGDPQMVAGLKKRGLTPDQAFCLPLTAGNFFTEEYQNSRLMKVPCYHVPEGSNYYAKPIEGLFAVYDIGKKKVLKVIDTGAIAGPKDNWGYTEK